MEDAAPEGFWVDKAQCQHIDINGQIQNPALQPCIEGISAVKALSIAQKQGQKIYTINPDNRATALPRLTIGGEVGVEIRNAIQAGKEVTFHEARINEHGWSGYGYSIIDLETGVGGYLIEGKGNGAYQMGERTGTLVAIAIIGLIPVKGESPLLKIGAAVRFLLAGIASFQIGLLIGWSALDARQGQGKASIECYLSGLVNGIIAGAINALDEISFKNYMIDYIINLGKPPALPGRQ